MVSNLCQSFDLHFTLPLLIMCLMFIIDIVSLGNYSFRYLKYLKAILHQDTYKNKLRRRPKSLIDSEQISLARMDYKKEKFQTTAPLWEFQQYWYSFPTLRFIMTIKLWGEYKQKMYQLTKEYFRQEWSLRLLRTVWMYRWSKLKSSS